MTNRMTLPRRTWNSPAPCPAIFSRFSLLVLPRPLARKSTRTRSLSSSRYSSASWRKSSQPPSQARQPSAISASPVHLPGAGPSANRKSMSESAHSLERYSPRSHSEQTDRTSSTFADAMGPVSPTGMLPARAPLPSRELDTPAGYLPAPALRAQRDRPCPPGTSANKKSSAGPLFLVNSPKEVAVSDEVITRFERPGFDHVHPEASSQRPVGRAGCDLQSAVDHRRRTTRSARRLQARGDQPRSDRRHRISLG